MSANKYLWIIGLLLLTTVTAVSITVWTLFSRQETPVIAPDYAPIETEKLAEPIPDDTSDKLASPENGGAVSLSYSDQVTITLSSKTATLMFANPGRSNMDMLLQIVVHDVVLLQSGRITPGNRVTSLELLPEAVDMLAPGGYDGVFVVSYYDQGSGEKQIVDVEIPISITVCE